MKTEPNEPATGYAMTTHDGSSHLIETGLTKREHMAIEFCKALLGRGEYGASDAEGNALMAIQQADELIKQLNQE